MSSPLISVVIPTRDRRDALMHTLDRLDAQDIAADAAEVIVVDNGSTDGTGGALAARGSKRPVRVLSEPKPGPAAARNRGIEAAAADVVLLLGDDMAPADDGLLSAHVELHSRRSEAGYGVLGRVTWWPERGVTPFMYWLEHGGPQFAFDSLAAGPVPPAANLFTAHLSLKRALFLEEPFDERFPYAAVEDSELGVRLERRGLELDYHPELLVYHDHPTDVWAFAQRLERVGQSAQLFHRLHPTDRTANLPRPAWWWRAYPAAGAAARAVLRATDGRGPRRAWSVLLMSRYARGYRGAELQQ
jgi:glycosyltransferase involved in cell wall biosynthesis